MDRTQRKTVGASGKLASASPVIEKQSDKTSNGLSTLEIDDDVNNLNCLASKVSNVVTTTFEQRRFSEKNFKIFTNHIHKEGKNVSQIILELEDAKEQPLLNSAGKVLRATAKTKKSGGILQSYLSNNS